MKLLLYILNSNYRENYFATKLVKMLILYVILVLFSSCSENYINEKKLSNKNNNKEFDSSIDNVNVVPFDSLVNINIDTTSLIGKRQYLPKVFYEENRLSIPSDSLFDVNYDGFSDYIIKYYAQSGNGIKNRIYLFIYNPELNNYILDKSLTDLPNPTFYISRKLITGFYLAHGGGNGIEYRWINKQWMASKIFDVSNDGDSSKWKIEFPLKKLKIWTVRPYVFIPPKDILETQINY